MRKGLLSLSAFLLCGLGLYGAVAEQESLASAIGLPVLPPSALSSSWVSTVDRIDELDARADRQWCDLNSRDEYDALRRMLKDRFFSALGEFPPRTPMNAQVVSNVQKDGYRVEKILFQSMPGIFVTANFFIPTGIPGPCPVVVMSCGHSRLGKDCPTYLRACRLLVDRGIAAFMFDPYEQGERILHPELRPTDAHNNIGVKAMLLGWSMPMLRIWDGMRAIDYVESRQEVDRRRIGYMGQSGGGTLTALMTAADGRLKATAPSCYLTNFRQLCRNLGPQDAEQNVFGQLAFGVNHAGLVLLQDTRVCITGRMSDFFPYEGALETGHVVSRVASMLGCPEHYAMNFAPGGHGWAESTMTASADWMAAWLCGRKKLLPLDTANYRALDVVGGNTDLGLDEHERGVVDGGLTFGLKGARSIHDVLRERNRRFAPARAGMSMRDRSISAQRFADIHLPDEKRMSVRVIGESRAGDVSVCRLAFVGGDGLARPAVLLTPMESPGRDSVAPVLMTGASGRAAFVADAAAALDEGRVVLVADAFACGEIRGPATINGRDECFYDAVETPEESVAVMLYLMGESLVGRRADDILEFSDYLTKRTGRAPRILATESVTVAAAHAVAANPDGFAGIEVRNAPPSWSTLVDGDNGAGRCRYAWSVNSALTQYDWTDLLPAHAVTSRVETAYWQREIDRTSAKGGGVVSIPVGEHLTGGLYLKDNVTLRLERGCVLRGVTDPMAYPPNELENVEIPDAAAWRAIVSAIAVTNVAIEGAGTIFGDGTKFPSDAKLNRPRGLLFYRCRDVRLEKFTLRDSANWSAYLKECDGVLVRGYRADSHGNATCDGLDIDSRNVLVEDCDIDSGDDGICLKSDNPDFAVENVEVRNCRIASCSAAIKLGTGSHGAFRGINIHDCKIVKSLRTWMDPKYQAEHYRHERNFDYPGCGPELSPITAIALESVDGAAMADVRVRNIEIEETAVPLFVRLGARRHRRYRGEDLPMPFGRNPGIENVLIENVRALSTSVVASSITGVPEFRVKNVTLRNLEISCPASGIARGGALRPVPECVERKPGASMFECQVLPAYGLYARHVDGLKMENVTFKIREGVEEREAVVTDDCTEVICRGCSLQDGQVVSPGTIVGRIGIVTNRETIAESFRRFSDRRFDLVIVDGIVGGQTSDTELLWLRALRDRYFVGPDRREVIYRYSSPVTMRQQELLDANGNVAFRDQKGQPVAVISSGIASGARDMFLDKTVKAHLRGIRDALLVDGKRDFGEMIEIRR